MEEEKKELVSLLQSVEFKQWLQTSRFHITKNSKQSDSIRQETNKLLNSNFHNADVHEEVWKNYSLCVALAENGTEGLALAYGNRSFVLMHMGKYVASIEDIDRAIDITKNKSLSIKLLLRKVKCLHALGSEECKSVYRKAEQLWNRITDESVKKLFKNDIDKMKLLVNTPLKEKSASRNKKSEMLDELDHQYKVNDFSSVKVHYSSKFGRHLIAAKDFRPGDVIYIEKPFVQAANIPRSHAFCSYCFTTSWANIPCDHCAWTMFCSEQCKKEAWIKYHDIECSLYGYAKEDGNDKHKQVAVRMLIMALKEFGSVEKLQSELVAFHKCTDKKKGFVVDDKIETDGFKTLYTLSRNVSKENLKKHKGYTQMVLTALAKNTNYFGENFAMSDVNSYKRNENAVFLGSLFLRLSKISQLNSRQMWNHTYDCKRNLDHVMCSENQCCSPGAYIAPISGLLNHSCHPNVRRCYTDDHTVVLYAVLPIKKASQIFDCYTEPYYIDNLEKRQIILSHFYNLNCDCIACKQQWPDRMQSMQSLQISPVDMELAIEFKDLMTKYYNDAKTNYNDRTIARLRDGVEKGLHTSSQPSTITRDLIDGLQVIFNQIYGINLLVPKKCNL